MLDGQDTKPTVSSGNFADSTKLLEVDYRIIVTQLYNEIAAKDARLKGVQALTIMLHESEEKCRRLEDTAKNYEMTLRRAEARIAQLNKIHGIGPQTAFNRGVVLPGVSRKEFELPTKENLKLKEALNLIAPSNLGGHEVIVKNQELYNLVSRLREDLSQREHHIKELESALKIREDGGISTVPDLTRKLMKLDRSLNAKQVFCETLIKENEKLTKLIDEVRDNSEERDDIDGRKQEVDTSAAVTGSIQTQFMLLQENSRLKLELTKMKKKCDGFYRQVTVMIEERLRQDELFIPDDYTHQEL